MPFGGSGGLALTQAPGYEIGYTEVTADVTIPTGGGASRVTAVDPGSLTFDGSPVLLTFYCAGMETGVGSGQTAYVAVYESTTNIAILVELVNPVQATNSMIAAQLCQYRFTPSAGAHHYLIQTWMGSSAASSGTMHCASASAFAPMFARFTKV